MARELCGEKSRNNMVSSAGFCYSDVSSPSNPNPITIQTQFTNQIQQQSFHQHHHHHHDQPTSEIFNLTTGMEMIGFSKNSISTEANTNDPTTPNSSSTMWKGFISKHSAAAQAAGPSSSKNSNDQFYGHPHHDFNKPDHFTAGISAETSSDHHQNLIVGPADHSVAGSPWQENRFLVDDSSLRCVFSCEGNERPSQGLSLSLNSSNPSSIGLQSFELRQTNHHHHQEDHQQHDLRFISPSSRDGFFGKLGNNNNNNNMQPHQMIQDGFLGKATNLHHQGQFQLRNSKYLSPAQELLNEFCSLGTKQSTDLQKQKASHKNKQQWESEENGASSSKKQSLYSLEFMELQKRKTKLLSMLEEVERRYKHYCDQMRAVVSSFEAVAGAGAATVYSALASKAMSKHFRCLKDGIVSQIQATRKAMGEKDAAAAPGSTRGETPRLRILDQALRQQRAFQQMTMMESHPWRPQRGLPERSVSVLRAWLFEHFLHPYPSDVDKHILARQTGLSRSQVSNWFINARVRLWKPMVEEMYLEETKEREAAANNIMMGSSSSDHDHDHGVVLSHADTSRSVGRNPDAPPPPPRPEQDQKPTPDQLVRIDSDCLSSIVINPDKTTVSRSAPTTKNNNNISTLHQVVQRQQNFGRFADAFGTMELDFSSYNHGGGGGGGQSSTSTSTPSPSAGAVLYASNDHHSVNQGFRGGGGGGVSLTLGLQQHAGGSSNGVSLAFSPAASHQSSLFYTRDHIDECQVPATVQYSLLDGDQGQNNLPYRNLMGAQLLHDLA